MGTRSFTRSIMSSTRAEGLVAMGSAGCADHRDITDLERAHAVQSSHACPRDLGFDLGSNAIHLGDRHCRVGLVLELGHRAPVVDVAHGSDEKRSSARARVRDERRYFVDGKRFGPNSDSAGGIMDCFFSGAPIARPTSREARRR